ncbi:MAG: transporter associated domain-containing protein [Pirellulaceae bacterium]
MVGGTVRVDELNELLGTDIPEDEDYDTIAGLVMHELKMIPKVGATMTYGDIRVTILSASRRTVEQVEVQVIADENNGTALAS